MSRFLMFGLVGLVGCVEGGLEVYSEDARVETGPEEQGWWWWASSPDEEDEVELDVPDVPGDPTWFDAHCDDSGCTVRDVFEPRDWLWTAQALCHDALGTEEAPGFEVLAFDMRERVYADEFRASEADWRYMFTLPDPDDLWGYRILECTVDVSDRTVSVDDSFGGNSLRSMPVEEVEAAWVYGVAHAASDMGSFDRLTGGGVGWVSYEGTLMVWMNDSEYGDHDSWFALTGEED